MHLMSIQLLRTEKKKKICCFVCPVPSLFAMCIFCRTLPSMGFNGTLSPRIGELTYLTVLWVKIFHQNLNSFNTLVFFFMHVISLQSLILASYSPYSIYASILFFNEIFEIHWNLTIRTPSCAWEDLLVLLNFWWLLVIVVFLGIQISFFSFLVVH